MDFLLLVPALLLSALNDTFITCSLSFGTNLKVNYFTKGSWVGYYSLQTIFKEIFSLSAIYMILPWILKCSIILMYP